jgi:hypothetical protein
MGYEKCRYAIAQCKSALDELQPVSKKYGIYTHTLFWWEQNKGNRWNVTYSEADIAIEQLDPFNSHLLHEIFLGVDDIYTTHENNIFFRKMIDFMWPELLNWPVNPASTFRDWLVQILKRLGLLAALKELRYQLIGNVS